LIAVFSTRFSKFQLYRMNTLENIRLALIAIRSNLLRTILTLSIIAFGIMALVGILTAIDSATFALSDSFSRLGANSFNIYPKSERVRGRRHGTQDKQGAEINFEQATEFKERFDFSGKVSVAFWCTGSATVKHGNEETNPNVTVSAIDENYVELKGYEIAAGRNFSSSEALNGGNKVILGHDIIKQLFNEEPEKAVNTVVSIGNSKYRVVGVLKSRGSTMNQNDDRRILIPLLEGKRFYGTANTNYNITVGVNNAAEIEDGVAYATGLMRNVRRLKASEDSDFEVFKSDNLIAEIKENTAKLRTGAVAIGLITLLGAAIGLMNIMLVSVTERTREIGIVKAIGATRRNVMVQFLTEAIVIAIIGGLVGIVLGMLIGNVVTFFMGGKFLVPWGWIFVAIVTCTITGLMSGLYPALKAARQDPIEALRYE
jgi:putative ABC transport system permease protein